jgi:hypothetical protein
MRIFFRIIDLITSFKLHQNFCENFIFDGRYDLLEVQIGFQKFTLYLCRIEFSSIRPNIKMIPQKFGNLKKKINSFISIKSSD